MQRINQAGFTLFELAISIATICLLASFMLMIGHTVTINTKVNRLDRDLNSIRSAIYDAQDKSSPATSGNMRKLPSRIADSAGPGDSNNLNAIIGGGWRSASGENFSLWKRIRPAGLGKDAVNNAYAPLKMSGDSIDASEASNPPIAGINGNYIICTNNIAGTLAKRLDFVMDDGNTGSGTMMASSQIGGAGIATDEISGSEAYLICLGV
ncbi:hypothetical protein GALL_167110 [mine drainage metagenome]|uniref:Prepilin-type N-terminal cleavage/methylation domain-containing protein n=1 Tax=mine drainage metagenome TaxID=410659 RepID=A0A1J5RZ92_9ZZZZ